MFFVGKHRDYVDQLWTLNKIQESYFKRLVDLYAIAAIIGIYVVYTDFSNTNLQTAEIENPEL